MAYTQRKAENLKRHDSDTDKTAQKLYTELPLKKVERGDLFNSIKITKRSEDYWILSHSLFWNTQNFREAEKNRFKHLIADHFSDSKDIDQTFTELVERACLAKRHTEDHESRYIPQPEVWFNFTHPNGLSTTNKWYAALRKQRSSCPEFSMGLTLFAQAIISYADTRNILDIVFYRQVFLDLTHYDLLQWYMNAVMHYQFINF